MDREADSTTDRLRGLLKKALGLFVRVELSRTPGFSVENVELTPDQVAARAIFEKRLADLSDRDAQFLIEFLRRL
jgi:hypothetical protein